MGNENNLFDNLPITPEMVPTIPITPTQEAQLLALIEQMQIAVNTYLNNPIPANNTALRTVLTNLFTFLRDQFPTQAGRDATRYSLFLLSTVNNRLASATPSQSSEVAVMLQSLYTTLSILISEFIMTNVVRNQFLNILATLVQTTSDDAGAAGPTGPTGPIGPTGPTGPTGSNITQNAAYFYSTTTNDLSNNVPFPIDTIGFNLGTSVTLLPPNTVRLTQGLYEISYMAVGDPVGGNETLIIELRVDDLPLEGSRVYSQSVTGGGQPQVDNTILVNVTNSQSNIQLVNVSGEPIQYLSSFPGAATTSMNIIKLN
ncbi:collagen-like repeat preface domain-containing protein [Bacillus cereus]